MVQAAGREGDGFNDDVVGRNGVETHNGAAGDIKVTERDKFNDIEGVGVDNCELEVAVFPNKAAPGRGDTPSGLDWDGGNMGGALPFVGGVIDDHGDGHGGSRQESVGAD